MAIMAIEADMALSSSIGWEFSMASGGRAVYTIPSHPHVSSSASLHNAHTALLLFLSHLYNIFVHHSGAHEPQGLVAVSRPLSVFCLPALHGIFYVPNL